MKQGPGDLERGIPQRENMEKQGGYMSDNATMKTIGSPGPLALMGEA